MNSFKYVFLLLPLLLSGCGSSSAYKSAASYFFINPHKNLSDVGRTAFIELTNDSAYPQISVDVTEALYQAMQKKQLFGITAFRQNDPAWLNMGLDLKTAYTLEQLSAIHRTLNCGAVLRGTVTKFEPFPHLVIGLRLELIDLSDGELLWALEQIWDATDKSTQERIKDYFKRQVMSGSGSLQEDLGTVSSLKFFRFVAFETAETLQPKR
jgi:hypothetical protein